jgi:peptidoglycan/LPS O-acetylase OafA/YrhL
MSSLDGLRGVAAVAVMMFHFDYFFLPQASLRDWLPFLNRAYLGVDVFFLISGFVMAHVYGLRLCRDRRANWRDFAALRFARIYPLFALTTLIMVVIHALSAAPLSWVSLSTRSLTLQPLLLQIWAPGLSWNYPSWSISTEAAAYAVFVFSAAPLLAGRHARIMGAVCIGVLAALSLSNGGRLHVFNGLPALLRTLAEFSLGVLLYRAHLNRSHHAPHVALLLAAGCAALALATGWDLPIVAVFAYLIYAVVNGDTLPSRLLNSAPATAVGAWSYSIYLWHAPVHYAVMAGFAAAGRPVETLDPAHARLLLPATMVCVVCLSAFTFKYFEAPMRRWIGGATLATIGAIGQSRIGQARTSPRRARQFALQRAANPPPRAPAQSHAVPPDSKPPT